MSGSSESLERKLGKPDWKQWWPVYGLFQEAIDEREGRPIVGVEVSEGGTKRIKPLTYIGNSLYQSASIVAFSALSACGIYEVKNLVSQLF